MAKKKARAPPARAAPARAAAAAVEEVDAAAAAADAVPAAGPEGRAVARGAAVAAVVALAVFANSLQGEFLFDDGPAIKDNKDVKMLTPLSSLLVNDFWGQPIEHPESHKSYRPLTVLSFRLTYMVAGLSPLAFHAGNVVLHAAASALVVPVAQLVLRGDGVSAAVAGVLFALHPVHTEAVANCVGRAESLCAIFFLLAILFFDRAAHARQTNFVYLVAAQACAVAAVLSKETGITVFGVFGAYDILYVFESLGAHGRKAPKSFKQALARIDMQTLFERHVVSLTVIMAYLITRHQLAGGVTFSRPFGYHEAPLTQMEGLAWLLSAMFLHAYYLWLVVVPAQLCAEYSFNCIPMVEGLDDPRNLLTLLAYAAVFGLLAIGYARRSAATVMAVALFVLPFLPATQFFFPVGTAIGERLLYLPSLGYCVLLGALLEAVRGRKDRQKAMIAFLALTAVAYAGRTVVRNGDWRNYDTIWMSAESVCPQSSKVLYSVSLIHIQAKRFPVAEDYLRRSLAISEDLKDSHWRMGKVLFATSNITGAVYHLERCRELGDKFNCPLDLAIVASVAQGRTAFGVEMLGYIEANFPNMKRSRNVHANYGSALAKVGRHEEAIEQFRKALAYESRGPEYHNNVGASLYALGRYPAALASFEEALRWGRPHAAVAKNAEVARAVVAGGIGAAPPGFVPQYAWVMDGIGSLFAPG